MVIVAYSEVSFTLNKFGSILSYTGVFMSNLKKLIGIIPKILFALVLALAMLNVTSCENLLGLLDGLQNTGQGTSPGQGPTQGNNGGNGNDGQYDH